MAFYLVTAVPKQDGVEELGERLARDEFIGMKPFGRSLTYSLRNGGGSARLQLMHHGKEIEVTQVKPVVMPIPEAMPPGPSPVQPAGRAPVRRAVTA